LASPEIVRSYADDLHDLLNRSSLAERRKSFIKEVKVTEKEVSLTYTIPLTTAGISEETVGVLSTVQNGGPWLTVPELFFEKKELIPVLQQLLLSNTRETS